MDEDEERRKRRREKNKVAAARCRNKKKERTDFLQRVSSWHSTAYWWAEAEHIWATQPNTSRLKQAWVKWSEFLHLHSFEVLLIIQNLCPGIGASGDGELWPEGPDRGAPHGEAAADGDAQSPPAHLHCEDRQRQNTWERGQPPAGAAVCRRQVKPGNQGHGVPEARTSTATSYENITGNTF